MTTIVLKKAREICVQGKNYPNESGKPFEVDDYVCGMLDDAKIIYQVVPDKVKKVEKVKVEKKPELPKAPKTLTPPKAPKVPKKGKKTEKTTKK